MYIKSFAQFVSTKIGEDRIEGFNLWTNFENLVNVKSLGRFVSISNSEFSEDNSMVLQLINDLIQYQNL